MLVCCGRCGHRGQIKPPPIGRSLKCSHCGFQQKFGRARRESDLPKQQRSRRHVVGAVRLFARQAPPIAPAEPSPFDDGIDDLWDGAKST